MTTNTLTFLFLFSSHKYEYKNIHQIKNTHFTAAYKILQDGVIAQSRIPKFYRYQTLSKWDKRR